jgi:hypothetical protein
MNSLRHTIHYNSLIVILWGLIFAKCFTLEYFVQIYAVPINSALYIWSLSLSMATVATFVFLRLKATESGFQGSAQRNLLIWGTSGIAMIVTLAAVFLSDSINAYLIPSFLAVILGAGYLTHGVLSKNPIYTFSGIGWWIGSAVLFSQGTVESLLCFAFLILALSVCTTVMQIRRSNQALKQASCH